MNLDALTTFAIKHLEPVEKTKFFYHNVSHALDVFESVGLYAANEKIIGEDLVLLKTAAILHDFGIIISYQNHEEKSVKIAKSLLPEYSYTKKQIDIISRLIMATKIPSQPKNMLEKLICDADLDYLGREDYFDISERLRKEWAAFKIKEYSLHEWYIFQLDYMKKHSYYTRTARLLRNKGKTVNINKIKEFIKKV